jgi:uncharacterized membrane protein
MTNAPDAALARLERHLGWLLISGVAVSSALLLLGLLLQIVSPVGSTAGHFLAIGLIILMATPILRVVVSIVEYVRMREWFFVVTTVVVFIELMAGVTYALRR